MPKGTLGLLFILNLFILCAGTSRIPLVINTWNFTNATAKAWEVVNGHGKSAVTAIVEGCSVCESQQCDGTVGFGGSPTEEGETVLDAMIMDGRTMNIGAVAGLRHIKDAISVARHVLDYTKHTLLVGDQATEFAVKMGFKKEEISSERSKERIKNWINGNCQPNYWTNVVPDPGKSCGPYEKKALEVDQGVERETILVDESNHDTIGMVVIDKNGNIAAGTSTNGLTFKIPGRVGDSPIPGSGAYAENGVGGAAATGDGDIMMRFSPSFLALEYLRNGLTPKEAADKVIDRIFKFFPTNAAALIVTDMTGNYAAACQGLNSFPFSVYYPELNEVKVEVTKCRIFGEEATTTMGGSVRIMKINGLLGLMVALRIAIVSRNWRIYNLFKIN